ncbi:digestive organ expansion factor homolog [Patiria miniata]|uniref:U3 small nucleolar RNA-associated protein 25 homolog n=1 Tax=Patiria miniata TaxID=46514 RepID=A0A914BH83_PATMI|nr:digestive organ expansion factor homolog [Patiria miniata]
MRGNKRQKHGKGRRKKRRKIDLLAISRKVNERKKAGTGVIADSRGTHRGLQSGAANLTANNIPEEDYSSDSSVEQEPSAYEQLLTTLGTTKEGQYSDDEEEDEESGEDDDEDDEGVEEWTEGAEDGHEDEDETESGQFTENAGEEIQQDEDTEEDIDDDEDDDINDDEDDDINDEATEDDDETKSQLRDPFYRRMTHDIGEVTASQLAKGEVTHKLQAKWNALGRVVFSSMSAKKPGNLKIPDNVTFKDLNVKKRISGQWEANNKQFMQPGSHDIFTPLQLELFTIMNSYQDLLHTERTHKNAEEIRHVYCLHLLNHIVKSREIVLKHNTMLSKDPTLDTETMRDQGLTRPRILIVVPFRDGALRIINTFIKLLLAADSQNVGRRKRFNDEYGAVEPHPPSKHPMPEDWESTFAGNIDDHFRIGLAITRKRLQLYTDFYMSDIIIASPLGLRTLIGTKGEKHQDYDFLSSIELLVMDQADVFLMQNWEHITHLMDYMHLQPRDSHGVDFSRLREWTLNGWSKHYRQTLIFSSIVSPEINSLFNKQCANLAGRAMVYNPPVTGSICQVVTQLPQVFHRIECQSFLEESDKRFDFFLSKVLPQYRDPMMVGTMIFVPNYFDFVRLRNYFRKQELQFAQICEYTSQPNISRARLYIANQSRNILLYTERFHYFRRYKIKGIHNLIFYQLPSHPQFYSELCNILQAQHGTTEDNCSILYTRYDAQKLAAVVGSNRCGHMLSSDKDVHLLVTGADS